MSYITNLRKKSVYRKHVLFYINLINNNIYTVMFPDYVLRISRQVKGSNDLTQLNHRSIVIQCLFPFLYVFSGGGGAGGALRTLTQSINECVQYVVSSVWPTNTVINYELHRLFAKVNKEPTRSYSNLPLCWLQRRRYLIKN